MININVNECQRKLRLQYIAGNITEDEYISSLRTLNKVKIYNKLNIKLICC